MEKVGRSLATVVADTSIITMSTAYASHFHIYVDGKENAKMIGDRMKMLMLTLLYMVRDLIAPDSRGYCIYLFKLVCTVLRSVCTGIY